MKNRLHALILGGALLAGASVPALARDNVSFSLAFGVPAYTAPAYTYYDPPPVYYAPPPPVYYRPAPAYYAPPAVSFYYRDGWRHHHRHHHRHHR